MEIERYDWNDLYKKAEGFIHRYIPEAVVCTSTRRLRGEEPIVDVSFPEKRNRTHLEDLDKEKCFTRLRRSNVGGSRIVKGEILFNKDGSLK